MRATPIEDRLVDEIVPGDVVVRENLDGSTYRQKVTGVVNLDVVIHNPIRGTNERIVKRAQESNAYHDAAMKRVKGEDY